MNTLPIDSHDMIKYGYIRKEDIIVYYKDDNMFRNFNIISLDDDEFDLPYDDFVGTWQYNLDFGLGIDFKISIFDMGTGPTLLTFSSNFESDNSDLAIENIPYQYDPISEDVDMGYRLIYKQYTITYRNQIKQIITKELPNIAKELLHHLILISNGYNSNLNAIHKNCQLGFEMVDQPGPSHHQLRKNLQDYNNNIIKFYPYLLDLSIPNEK